MTENILILVDSPDTLRFFLRLSRALVLTGKTTIFFTYRISLYAKLKKNKQRVCLVRKSKSKESYSSETFEITKNACDVLSGKISHVNSVELYESCFCALEFLDSKNFGYVFIWNGSNAADLAVGAWAKRHNLKTLYFEVGNMPGKIFVDPLGVNAKSLLMKDHKLLDMVAVNDSEYESWKKEYLDKKLKKASVPQSSGITNINYQALVDRIFSLFYTPVYEDVNPFLKFLNKIRNRVQGFEYDEYDIFQGEYAFLPLQVSSDSQILLNSDVSIIEAIKYSSRFSSSAGLDLIVKPHPAEPDKSFVENLFALKESLNFKFVTGNIFEIIKNSKIVITINSTAGLEAKILDKDVIYLGSSFYSKFNQEDMRKYITGYLIDIDFFSEERISKNIAEKIISRAI